MRTIVVFAENRPFFGALLVHVPLLHELRCRHPDAQLVVFSPFPQASLLAGLGCADRVEVYERGIGRLRRRLAELAPEIILVLRPASRWLDIAAGLQRARVRAGFDSLLGRLFYTRAVFHDTSMYRPRKYLTLLDETGEARRAPLEGWFRLAARGGAWEPRGGARTFALLPGGGAGEFKLWGARNFIDLAGRLAGDDPDLEFVWVLGPQEGPVRAAIEGSAIAARSSILSSPSVADLARAAFASVGAAGNDCGPGHVFQMCGCPYAAVMSDQDARVRGRIAEWIDEGNRPHVTAGERGRPIGGIPVARVGQAVSEMLRARRN